MWVLLGLVSLFLIFGPIVIAMSARSRIGELSRRLERLEAAIDNLRLGRPAFDGEAPSAPAPVREQPPVTPPNPLRDWPLGSLPPLPPRDEPDDIASEPPSAPPPTEPPPPSDSEPPPPSEPSFEERLGARWAVWAGGAALALGGLLLVRYSIEAGLFGPAFRVTAGALLAAVLIGAGERMRRGELSLPADALPQAHIPSVLTAAGTSTAFATIFAAHALYGFIGPASAFVLLGATGVVTMLAAALHGPWLAGLGLLASYATPLLVVSNEPRVWPLVLFISAITAFAYLLARARRWTWLAKSALVGGALWAIMLVSIGAMGSRLSTTATAIFLLIQLGLAALFLAVEPHADEPDQNSGFDRFTAIALAALTVPAAMYLANPAFDFTFREIFAVAALALLTAAAWRAASVAVAALIGAVLTIVTLLAWPGLTLPPDVTLTAPWAEGVLRLPDNVSQFLSFAAFATLIPAAIMALRLWRGRELRSTPAALYVGAATLSPLLALILAYLRVTQFDVSIPFAVGGAALAVGFAIAAEVFHRAERANASPAHNMAAGILAAAAIAAMALALTMALERGYLTVAFAIAALGASVIAANRDLAPLRGAIAALGLIVLARIAWEPRIMGEGVGATPIFNWLLIGYGVPALCFYLAARNLETRRDDLAVRVNDALAVIFAALLAFFQVRHLTNGGDVLHEGARLVESGLHTFVALALSFALARMNLARANPVFDAASLIFGVGSVAFAVIGLMIFANPLFTGDSIDSTSLALGYLLPGAAALFVARHTRGVRPEWYVRAAGVLGVALIATYVTLEVRHAFQGPILTMWRPTSDAEHWTYSAAWLALGVAFLGYGLLRGSVEARAASAVLIVLTALKVTFFDLAGIGGFWRALSFLSLGAVLIGIGLVYQRLIFAPERRTPM